MATVIYTAFAAVTDDDRAGQLWITTIVCVIYSALTTIARARIKYGAFGLDDGLVAVATIFYMAQAAAVFTGLKLGLSQSKILTNPDQWPASGRTYLGTQILAIIVLCLAKCSNVALMTRVFSFNRGRRDRVYVGCCALQTLNLLWAVSSIAALASCCDPALLLTVSTQCSTRDLQWKAITAADIVTEILACLCPVYTVSSLHMARKLKVQAILAFVFRLTLIPTALVYLSQIRYYTASSDPQLAVTSSLLTQQAMLATSIITATIPNIRAFLTSLSIGFGVPMNWGQASKTTDRAYGLQTIGGTFAPGQSSHAPAHHNGIGGSGIRAPGMPLRPDEATFQTTVTSEGQRKSPAGHNRDSSRSSSRENMIRKDVEWHVQHS